VQVHRLLPTGAVVETAEGDIGTAQQWQCAGCSAVYVVLQGRLVPSREAWE
jgi:hypothetical protein